MPQDSTSRLWTKAIPPARDRLQSRILVWIVVPVLCYLNISTFRWGTQFSGRFLPAFGRYDDTLTVAVAISIFFALIAWHLKAATPLAAACGGMICFQATAFNTSSVLHSGLAPLILLFVLTFEATRLGRKRKARAGLAESSKGRNASQVIANLGIVAIFSSMLGVEIINRYAGGVAGEFDLDRIAGMVFLPALAALAEATADTVSSEIGQVFGGRPRMITTLRHVEPGTDGAVTLIGTLAGLAAAAIVVLSAIPAMAMPREDCLVAFAAATIGLFFDSLLGATLERKGWLGNDLVNFFSTAFAAALALAAIRFCTGLY